MLAEVRGYTSETINCPEGSDDLKVWETLLWKNKAWLYRPTGKVLPIIPQRVKEEKSL